MSYDLNKRKAAAAAAGPVRESLAEITIRHLQNSRIGASALDTFAQWDICNQHACLYNCNVDAGSRDPQCGSCSDHTPLMQLTAPMRNSTDLASFRRMWQQTWAQREADRTEIMAGSGSGHDSEAAMEKRDAGLKQLANEPHEPRAWLQYWLAAWEARNKVVEMLRARRPFLDGTKACHAFIVLFVEDWQVRHPDAIHRDSEHIGPRPHIECPVHKGTIGAMFPVAPDAATFYMPDCFVCQMPQAHNAPVLPAEFGKAGFLVACGERGASSSRPSRMQDDDGDEEKA